MSSKHVTSVDEIPRQEWVEFNRKHGVTDEQSVNAWNYLVDNEATDLSEDEDDEHAIYADEYDFISGKPAVTIGVGYQERHSAYWGTFDETTGRFCDVKPGSVDAMFNWCAEHCAGQWLMSSEFKFDLTDDFRFSFVDALDAARFRAEFGV